MDNTLMGKPLQPLSHGFVLLVGLKPSNLSEEIKNHPRVIVWNSQDERWLTRPIPNNVRAIFTTRWMGHEAFVNIIKQARRKQITIFNPQGTGVITRQVRELLNLSPIEPQLIEEIDTNEKKFLLPIGGEFNSITPKTNDKTNENEKETIVALRPNSENRKLAVLHQYIDWSKNNVDNAKALLEKAQEHGIQTTVGSLSNMVHVMRKKKGIINPSGRDTRPTPQKITRATSQSDDAGVQMFDNLLKELKDMRELYVDTLIENKKLRAKVEKFRKFFED
jgi:hypothetical protein